MATTITANGINFPDGSAGSPSIGGTDTNTGLFTGSDIVGFATGGSERLRIDASGNVNIANDSGKLRLGTGADLELFHDSSHSRIHNNTGLLLIECDGTGVEINSGASTENMAKFLKDGAVELYYDNSKKFETTSSGVSVTGNVFPSANDSHALGGSSARWQELNISDVIDVSDNGKIRMGDSDDLQIYHDGTSSRIDSASHNLTVKTPRFAVFNGDGTEDILKAHADGAVELYYDNSKKLETVTGGVYVYGDIVGGVGGTGNISLGDSSKFIAGSGNDLQLYHDGSNSYIDSATGSFYIRDTGGAERVRINGYGTAITGGLLFGTDTAAANALDDYEEGTFTPDWNGSSAGTTTYSTNQGSYTKIGNIVHIRIYSGINGTSGSGNWRVTNLPFSSPSGLTYITTGSCMVDGLDFDSNYTWVVPYKNSASSQLDLYASTDNGGWDVISVSDDSSFAIILGITYVAA